MSKKKESFQSRQRLPCCGPRFESQEHHLRFFELYGSSLVNICHLNWNVKITKINEKSSGLAYLKKNVLKNFFSIDQGPDQLFSTQSIFQSNIELPSPSSSSSSSSRRLNLQNKLTSKSKNYVFFIRSPQEEPVVERPLVVRSPTKQILILPPT